MQLDAIDISQLRPGDSARVIGFNKVAKPYRQKLMVMGLTRGCVVRLLRTAPLGCPIALDVRGTTVSLRVDEAKELILERC